MTPTMRRALYLAPRVLCIAFAAFISLFALDVFDERRAFWPTAAALAMHLLPTALVVATLVLAWRREWVGAIVFGALGVTYVVASGGRAHWTAYAFIAGPLFLIGGLFLLGWRHRSALRGRA